MSINAKKMKPVFGTFIMIILYLAWPYLINAVLNIFTLGEKVNLYIKFFGNFSFLVVLLLIYRNDLKEDIKKFNTKIKSNLKIILISFLVVIGLVGVVNALITIIFPDLLFSNDIALLEQFSKFKILHILNVIIYYPICEEIIFKKNFKGIITNKWLFIILTGFINAFFCVGFTAINMLSYIFILPQMALLCGFSWAYYKSDNIWVAISSRILYNLFSTIISLL